jgi:hypothetical protein
MTDGTKEGFGGGTDTRLDSRANWLLFRKNLWDLRKAGRR